MMRSNTWHVSQNGLDTRGLDARGLFMCVSSHTTEVSLTVLRSTHFSQVLKTGI